MAKYKVGPLETWSQIAQKFNLPIAQLMQANKGVSTLSTGMGIRVPQYSQPIGPQRIGATGSVGGVSAAQSNARSGPYDNNLAGYYNDAYSKPATTSFPSVLAAEQSRTTAAPGRGSTAHGDRYDQMNRVGVPTATNQNQFGAAWDRYNGAYTSIMYERDPATGQPKYNYVQMRDSSGRPLTNRDGSPVTTPASIYANDVITEARFAGQSVAQFTSDLQKNGYVLFGGKWVYVGAGNPQPRDQRPARLRNGNLARRRQDETVVVSGPTGPTGNESFGTNSSTFNVGSG